MNLFNDLININIEKNMGVCNMTDEFFCLFSNYVFKKFNKNVLIVVNN